MIESDPELFERMLDARTLETLRDDLSSCVEVLTVQVRPHDASITATPGIGEAIGMLIGGRIRSIQIRYRFDGWTWCDTLLAAGAGTRLIRARLGSGDRES